MNVELTGAMGWIFTICVLTVGASIVIMGTWIILNIFIWDVLVRKSLHWLRLYGIFIHFIKYRHRYYKWAKRYEDKFEPGANNEA